LAVKNGHNSLVETGEIIPPPANLNPLQTDEIAEVRGKQLRRSLLLSSLIGAATGTLTALAFIWKITHPQQTSLLFWGFIGSGGAASGGAFVVALVSVIKLVKGPPRGARSPVKALRKFYSYSLISKGTIFAKVQAEAMFFLHPDAIASIGGWRGFNDYWTEVNNQIVESLRSVCENRLTGTRVEVLGVKPSATSENSRRFMVSIAFQTTYDQQDILGVYNTHTEGPWIFSAENEVVMKDSRWYLACAEWTGQPDPSWTAKRSGTAKGSFPEKLTGEIVPCPECGAQYRASDYRDDARVWLCSDCNSVLPRKDVGTSSGPQ
jgi:predicted RNA-binding Zn-ribbon protein involved in translation (DUF1610 family)